MTEPSKAVEVPLLLINALDDAALGLFTLVHAAGPGLLVCLGAGAVQLVRSVVVSVRHGLFTQSPLDVGAEGQLGIIGHVRCLFNLVDLASHNGVDRLISTSWEVDPSLGGERNANIGVSILLLAHVGLNVLGELLRG